MRFGSVCSGIEAASAAWTPLGWEAAWFSEIEPFPSSVLQHHYPDVPNLGDMTRIEENEFANNTPVDLVVGGTPCQGFSVAGLRKGLDDDRSNLCLAFIKLVHKLRSRWVVWENVPGVFTTSKGEDFGAFLSGLSGVDVPVPSQGWKNSGVVVGTDGSYSLAWRVLDAQYFGVPQRRRRVFVVGYLGDWRCAAAVLFERESLQGHPPPSREKREGVTLDASPCLRARSNSSHRLDTQAYVADEPCGETQVAG